MKLDPSRSRLVVHTFAEGLLSALAHDLELSAGDLEGEAEGSLATLRVPVKSIAVHGVLKRGRVDPNVLSAGDRATIERQIREDVLPGAEIVARGTRDGSKVAIEVTSPRGRTARASCAVTVTDEGGASRVKGAVDVSTAALGAPPVKGPMGAFRVRDAVRVEFELVFV